LKLSKQGVLLQRALCPPRNCSNADGASVEAYFFPWLSLRAWLPGGYVNADLPKSFALAQYEDEAHFWLITFYSKD